MGFQSNAAKKMPKKKYSENWNHLNQEVAESILRRLSFKDFYNFGFVCSSWQALLVKAVTNRHCYPLPQLPLLLLCPTTGKNDKVPCFFEVDKKIGILRFENKIYPRNQLILGTVNCWLIMAEPTKAKGFLWTSSNKTKYSLINLFFFHPMSWAKVMLPSEIMKDKDDDQIPNITKMVASSAPYDNCPKDEPVFVAGLTSCGIIFCKITDKSWKSIGRGTTFIDIVITGNLLYGLCDEDIEIYNLIDLDKSNDNNNHNAPKSEKLIVVNPKRADISKGIAVYLAYDVFFGDLILVRGNTSRFKVYELERTRNCEGVCEWMEIKDLGGRLIFVDEKSCRLISTLGLEEKNGRRNCIYFALNKYHGTRRLWNIDFGMFCLSDSSFHYIGGAESHIQNWANCFWLKP
ncbi:uncharacterized protein LOC114762260 [Neltuma alba]|uniref:uncharacterized protein LOC114762260 n=1 Tax=Neltuma alba TaxID=207710 RepID=UPI0010A40E8D|nr:uncharacterized protein LOC114762260 [Prosopis alba]